MTRPVDVSERVGQWFDAFAAIRAELTPQKLRDVLATMEEVQGISQLEAYMKLAQQAMANDRTAGVIAAMLTATGIKPLPLEDPTYGGNI